MRRLLPVLLGLALPLGAAAAAPLAAGEVAALLARTRLLQEEVGALEGELGPSPDLDAYEAEYLAALPGGPPRPIRPVRMRRALARADRVLLSDHHVTPASQARAVEVLEAMAAGPAPLTLVLEWIDARFQPEVDAYLREELDLEELRTRIHYDETWGFPWPGYASVLEVARARGVEVLVADSLLERLPLGERDGRVVERMRAHARSRPGARFLVVYGAYHLLGARHLRERLEAAGLPVDLVLTGVAPGVWEAALEEHRDPERLDYLQLAPGVVFVENGTPEERAEAYLRYLEAVLGYAE